MSIASVASIETLPVSGWDDPGLPIAIWRASLTSVGDASGGLLVAQFNLKAALVQPGNFFSLEELVCINSDVTDDPTDLGLDGMEGWAPSNVIRHWAIPQIDVDSATDLLTPISPRPSLFLGRGASDSSAGTLTFTLGNADGKTLDVAVSGYMWSARSTSQSFGGYRRPTDGMFAM